ncbi:ferrous iron transport protein B [Crateriforma conspicua]|uniref:Ferrous iron transport protein B n=1 Tax=Crateriforma conspicua TaxID=2527996 RepID=A0A5C5Y7T3_9PLAN|nr:ferrous iron transport protein B [Crateriforma conspicua]TWT70843.1 Ferrous iron transport protein B [Crateriforma conspicua]
MASVDQFQPPAGSTTDAIRVALVGNPNTGKSTLFNALAGMRVRTGNYPGVTITKKVGRMTLGDCPVDLIDLPGTYSLAPRSPDEMVAVEVLSGDLQSEPPVDVIVCVLNATLLQRSLFLVSQVLELGRPTLVVLNMSDTAQSRGLRIDAQRLERNLGCPVVSTSASKRGGIDELRQRLADLVMSVGQSDAGSDSASQRRDDWALPESFYQICDQFRSHLIQSACVPVQSGKSTDDLPANTAELPDDYLLQRALLDRGGAAEKRLVRKLGAAILPVLNETRDQLRSDFDDVVDMECSSRYTWAGRKLDGVLSQGSGSGGLTDTLDGILTHRVLGLAIFAGLMLLVFQSIYSLAGYPMDWIDAATGWASDLVTDAMQPSILRSLITDGVIAGVGGVVIFVPQIALLFFFLAVLEDCGYMARAAFLVDRIMRLFGLSGKSFLPLMSSFACAVPGVMATRVIENRRDRFATMMIAPLMSCSARLPVYLLLIGAFIPSITILGFLGLPALVLMSMYAVGVLVAIPVSLILKHTMLRGEAAPFVLELPEYQWPDPTVVFAKVWEASREFLVRAGTLILAASILIWFAAYWPGDHTRQYELQAELAQIDQQLDASESSPAEPLLQRRDEVSEELKVISSDLLESSLLGRVGHAIEPAVRPLGWDWKIGVGALASFPAREVIISTLGTIYSLGGDVDEEDEGLIGAIRAATWPDGSPVYTIPTVLSVMVFFALCAQCVSTLLVIRRETNSWRWPVFSFTYMTVVAYIGAMLTYQVGSLWTAG